MYNDRVCTLKIFIYKMNIHNIFLFRDIYVIIKCYVIYFRPTKQFITEEKMAAHLNGLHISSNYTQHSLASEDVMELSVEPNAMSISEKLKGHTIVLSEDVKKLQEEPILPQVLMERYVIKTCTLKKHGWLRVHHNLFLYITQTVLYNYCDKFN